MNVHDRWITRCSDLDSVMEAGWFWPMRLAFCPRKARWESEVKSLTYRNEYMVFVKNSWHMTSKRQNDRWHFTLWQRTHETNWKSSAVVVTNRCQRRFFVPERKRLQLWIKIVFSQNRHKSNLDDLFLIPKHDITLLFNGFVHLVNHLAKRW